MVPDAELDGPRLAREVGGAARRRRSGWRRWRTRRARWRRLDAAERVAEELLRLRRVTAAGEPVDRRAGALHFVGIGGAGMSGLALVAQQLGAR